MEAEIQQVEQTRVETNSVKAMKTGIQKVEQNTGADSVKGKKLTTKRGTKPPLNFLAILNDANKLIDASSPDELCDKLYAGVFLEENKLKYYVDKKLNKNCFVVFARKLSISWAGDSTTYWKWTKEKDTRIWDSYPPSREDIEVAELQEVCWLHIEGKIQTIDLSPGTEYEVVFVVKITGKGNMRHYSMTLEIILPSSKSLKRNESLNEKPIEEWFGIQAGEFLMSPENVGEITFKLGEYSSDWKTGLVVKCAIIRPKNY
ncbi:hypothetical protein ACB092_07G043900 [Castanea dentata]